MDIRKVHEYALKRTNDVCNGIRCDALYSILEKIDKKLLTDMNLTVEVRNSLIKQRTNILMVIENLENGQ